MFRGLFWEVVEQIHRYLKIYEEFSVGNDFRPDSGLGEVKGEKIEMRILNERRKK